MIARHAYKRGLPACGVAVAHGTALSSDTDRVTCPECIEWLAQLTEAHMVRHGAVGIVGDTHRTWCGAYSWPSNEQAPWPLAHRPAEMTCVLCAKAFDQAVHQGTFDKHERVAWLPK